MLLNAHIITRDQFEHALQNRVIYGGKIGSSLIELGYVSEVELARFLSNKLGVPYVDPDQLLSIPAETINLLPRELALNYGVIPLSLDRKRLNLVMSDPADLKAIDEISFITGYIIRPLVTPEVRLVQALGIYYQTEIDFRFQKIIEVVDARKHDEVLHAKELPAPAVVEEELEEAEIVVGAEWSERISSFAPDKVSIGLASAENRDEIADLVIGCLADRLHTAVLFLIKDDLAVGWKGVCRQEPIPDLAQIRISLAGQSAMKTVADGAGLYLGPLPVTEANNLLIEALCEPWPKHVLIMPLLISGRIVNLLYAEGDENLGEMVPELHKLLLKAALAFEVLIHREKILML
jgi:hypothetical protein